MEGQQQLTLLLYHYILSATHKIKRRWSIEAAELAVETTVDAAKYLASQRQYLQPRHLVLGCQGVDASQYRCCVERVLEYATAGDYVGLGDWCILGRFTTWLPMFYETINQYIPLIAQSPVRHVHIYGVLLEKALAPLLWMTDQYGLFVSSDSSRPIIDCTKPNGKKAGVKYHYWRDNVHWWQNHLANLRQSSFYRAPHRLHKQMNLFDLKSVA